LALYIDFESFDINNISNDTNLDDIYYQKVIHFLNQLGSNDSLFEVQTSGSTGIPKKISFSLKQAFISAELSNKYFGIDIKSVLFLPMNIDFVGAKMLIIRAFIAKAKLWIVKPTATIFDDIPNTISIDFVSLTSYQLIKTLESQSSYFSKVKKCLIGGSAISSDLKSRIQTLDSSCSFYESFGMSETLSHFAIKPLRNSNEIFEVIDGYQLQVSDEGLLSIICPFLDTMVQSNDIVELVNEHSFKFLGRKDNVINSGGIKIHPELLEKELEGKFNFQFYFSKAVDASFGEILILNILTNNMLSDIQILELCKTEIQNKYQIPKIIIRHDHFEYTENGKIKRV
jgi:O-succinylbenzoic acid--CoA ligase